MNAQQVKSSIFIKLRLMFRALQYRNFRLFFTGQIISLIGIWIQFIAMSWLVYRITDSPFWLGLVGFFSQIPALFIMPLAGVVADRYNRHRILILTQTLAMIQALILAILVLTDSILLWHIILLSILIGSINAFDMPTRHAFIIHMIDNREDISNAIALNSTMFNLARLIGPSLAGIIIAAWGEGFCFLINSISYIAVLISLFCMRLTSRSAKTPEHHIFQELKEAAIYAWEFTTIRTILLLSALMSLMGISYQILMPIFVRDIFYQGPQVLGFLMAAAGIGALCGALFLAMRKGVLGLGHLIPIAGGLFSSGLILFSLSRIFWVSMILILICGFGIMVQMAACNTLLQTLVDEDKRGRLLSFYTLSFMGMMPLGSLLSGWLASHIGAPPVIFLGGTICLLGSLFFLRKLPLLSQEVQPIYEGRGIIPPVAEGIQATLRF